MNIVRWQNGFAGSPAKPAKFNLFETPRFFLDVHVYEPGQSQAPHVHEGNDKVYLVVEGSGRFRVGEEIAELSAGDAVLAPAGVTHGAENPGPGRLVTLTFMAPHPRLG